MCFYRWFSHFIYLCSSKVLYEKSLYGKCFCDLWEVLAIPLENPLILHIHYIRPHPCPLLYVTVINGGTQGSHQTMLKEFLSLHPPRPPKLQVFPCTTVPLFLL